MIITHQCKTCPAVLTYDLRTNRRLYCEPCKRAADKGAKAASQRLRDARYGRACRGSIRGALAKIEKEENA